MNKICVECVSHLHEWMDRKMPPVPKVRGIKIIPINPYKRILYCGFRIMCFRFARQLTCELCTGSDRSSVPKSFLDAVDAPTIGSTPDIRKRSKIAVSSSLIPRALSFYFAPIRQVKFVVSPHPPFQLNVKEIPGTFDTEGVLGRDALMNFPVLLDPSSDPPITYIPARVHH